MSRFKGLLSSIKGNQQASIMILPYNRQVQEHQKIIKKLNLIYSKTFIQPYASFTQQLSGLNKSTLQQLRAMKEKPQFYILFVQTFCDMQKSLRSINHQIEDYLSEGFRAISGECQTIKSKVSLIYQKLTCHLNKQEEVSEEAKRYYKDHKILMEAIETYKVAFYDVKLIYNNQQKVKRYRNCQIAYYHVIKDLQQVELKMQGISALRDDLKSALKEIKTLTSNFIRVLEQQFIKIPFNISKCFLKGSREAIKKFGQKLKNAQQTAIKICFEKSRVPFPHPQFFSPLIAENSNLNYPSFIPNIKYLKIKHFGIVKKLCIEYYNTTRQDLTERHAVIQKMKNYATCLASYFQKGFINQLKDVKQMISQKFLKQLESYLSQRNYQNGDDKEQLSPKKQKNTPRTSNTELIQRNVLSMAEFAEEEKQLTKNMSKVYSGQTKLLLQELEEENKLLILFKDEFKLVFYSLFDNKKQFKKDLQSLKNGFIQSLSLTEEQIKGMREEIIKKLQFLTVLINGFSLKFKAHSVKTKQLLESILQCYNKHIGYQKQLYEKYHNRFNSYVTKLFENRLQVSSELNQQATWIVNNKLYEFFVKEGVKLKFQSQITKAQDFKKLKKPTANYDKADRSSFQISNGNKSPQSSFAQTRQSSNFDKVNLEQSFIENFEDQSQTNLPNKQKLQRRLSPFKIFKGKSHEQFANHKLKFQEDQKYVSSFCCGLADSIIISGRLYITTKRLFFHSHFNSSNIFFGSTKLEIPKIDITKIQKKYNALIFDNSILVTTVNGEIFFTSFISRDSAFDLICETFQINHESSAFISETIIQLQPQEVADFHITIQQQDDLRQNQELQRTLKVQELVQAQEKADQKAFSVPFVDVIEFNLSFPSLNAAKFFKIFDSGQQFSFKGKTYDSFWHYLKCDIFKHQNVEIPIWQQNTIQYLNPCNIKSSTPYKFARKSVSTVLLPKSNIPFMPKYVESAESSTLYFHSKDKYIITNYVQNSKAPYTDCFYMIYKKTVEKVDENTIKVKIESKNVFVKDTMMKSIIEGKSSAQGGEIYATYKQHLEKYLKYLQSATIKAKSNKQINQLSNNEENISIEQQKQQSKSGQRLTDSQQKLMERLQKTQKQRNVFKLLLLVSLMVNVLLIIICLMGGQTDTNTIVNQN